ncbi:hypothetical protein PIB30_060710 [Stylosanthes scabra]|uniref:Uncharacterized protein n=1 Tax=Stylosanthes scabra TaxID=79078 RepID=A0ABU6VIU1_9FABA|nr:hypothetical protein [Stylosanthes scabra]
MRGGKKLKTGSTSSSHPSLLPQSSKGTLASSEPPQKPNAVNHRRRSRLLRHCHRVAAVRSPPWSARTFWLAASDKMEGRFAEELYAESLEVSKSELKSTVLMIKNISYMNVTTMMIFGVVLMTSWINHQIWTESGKGGMMNSTRWGAVRGVASAFAHLPDELKEKLVTMLEKRNEFHGMHESVHSLSTADALRFFHEDIKAKEAFEQSKHVEVSPLKTSHVSHLKNYHQQLETLIRDTPAMDIHLPEQK